MKKNRIIIIIVAAVIFAGIGFGAGMMVKSSLASKASITADEAKQIVLSSVGVSAEKATFTKEVLDEGLYEIDFYTASNEYDFEVDASSGAIIDREVSPVNLSLTAGNEQQAGSSEQIPAEPSVNDVPTEAAVQNNNDNDVIGVAAAKEIALGHANVSGASFTKAYLDYDDGIRVYDIEFTADNKEYDFEINAYTGKIMSYDVERIEFDDYYDD